MPTLLLLNGPPAAGKSTLARRLVAGRRLALVLDIDVLRNQLGDWLDNSEAAGHAARALAITACRTHLAAGHDVVVPQFLGRVDFIEELAAVARESDARFIEVVLQLTRADAIDAFAERRANPTHSTHHDAAALIDLSESDDPVGEMYDALQSLIDKRPDALQVETVRGNVELTAERLSDVLRTAGAPW